MVFTMHLRWLDTSTIRVELPPDDDKLNLFETCRWWLLKQIKKKSASCWSLLRKLLIALWPYIGFLNRVVVKCDDVSEELLSSPLWWEKIPSCHFSIHLNQFITLKMVAVRSSETSKLYNDCTARKPKRRPRALDEARFLLPVTDRVTLSEWTSSNPELEICRQPNVFASH
jgi:hypothetical protein